MTPSSSLPVGETVEIRAADAPSSAPMEGRFVRLVPVSICVAVTATPGSAAPLSSTTRPRISASPD